MPLADIMFLFFVCMSVQMADPFMALNANCCNVVKATDFRFDKHVLMDSSDMTPYNISKKGGVAILT